MATINSHTAWNDNTPHWETNDPYITTRVVQRVNCPVMDIVLPGPSPSLFNRAPPPSRRQRLAAKLRKMKEKVKSKFKN